MKNRKKNRKKGKKRVKVVGKASGQQINWRLGENTSRRMQLCTSSVAVDCAEAQCKRIGLIKSMQYVTKWQEVALLVCIGFPVGQMRLMPPRTYVFAWVSVRGFGRRTAYLLAMQLNEISRSLVPHNRPTVRVSQRAIRFPKQHRLSERELLLLSLLHTE